MSCDIQSLATDSKCFLCASEKQLMAAQAYAAWKVWAALDGGAPETLQELLNESNCFLCSTTHKQLLAIIAYALCNVMDATPSGTPEDARVTDDGGIRVTDDGGIRVAEI